MKTLKSPVALAAAAALSALLAAAPARAGLVTSTAAVAFDLSASVTDGEGGGATSASNVPVGSRSVQQFDSALGVLTGAGVQLSSTRTQTTQVQATAGSGTGANSDATSPGTGSSSAQLTAAGVNAGFAALTKHAGCTGACTRAAAAHSARTSSSFAVSADALGSYVGTGTAGIGFAAPSTSAEQKSNGFSGAETTTSRLQWAGDLAMRYEYLLHAAASFTEDGTQTVLNLDFGNVAQGSAAMLGFGLFNLAGADRVGLDLDTILGTGDTTKLGTDLAVFTALAAGDGDLFQAMLDTSEIGDFAATYWLELSDADIGAEASRHGYRLRLNLSGHVLGTSPDTDAPDGLNGVPEPGSLALAALALAATGCAHRRRLRRGPAAG